MDGVFERWVGLLIVAHSGGRSLCGNVQWEKDGQMA